MTGGSGREHGSGDGTRKLGLMAQRVLEYYGREQEKTELFLWEDGINLVTFFSCALHRWWQGTICHTQKVSGHRLLRMSSWAGMLIFPSTSRQCQSTPSVSKLKPSTVNKRDQQLSSDREQEISAPGRASTLRSTRQWITALPPCDVLSFCCAHFSFSYARAGLLFK